MNVVDAEVEEDDVVDFRDDAAMARARVSTFSTRTTTLAASPRQSEPATMTSVQHAHAVAHAPGIPGDVVMFTEGRRGRRRKA
jgi:hypothetical protein